MCLFYKLTFYLSSSGRSFHHLATLHLIFSVQRHDYFITLLHAPPCTLCWNMVHTMDSYCLSIHLKDYVGRMKPLL